MKDGHIFDTKKATQERKCLYDFSSKNAPNFQFVFKCYICCFNADNNKQIYSGLKGKIHTDDILTGKKFCDMFNLDYDKIQSKRETNQERNVNYFIKELLEIQSIKEKIKKLIY